VLLDQKGWSISGSITTRCYSQSEKHPELRFRALLSKAGDWQVELS
jgi:hypothetical protein